MSQVTPSSEALDRHELRAVIREVLRHEPPFAPSEVEIADAVLAYFNDAIPGIVAAGLERMACRLDRTSEALLGRVINADQDHGVRAAAEFLRMEAVELRGEA